MTHTAAEIIARLLIAQGKSVLTDAEVNAALWKWRIFVSVVPNTPEQLVTIYNTQGIKQGRDMETGETQIRPGYQVMTRSLDTRGAYMANRLAAYFDTVYRLEVVVPAATISGVLIPTATYLVQNISQTSGVLSAGQDENKRMLHTINGLITVKQL